MPRRIVWRVPTAHFGYDRGEVSSHTRIHQMEARMRMFLPSKSVINPGEFAVFIADDLRLGKFKIRGTRVECEADEFC